MSILGGILVYLKYWTLNLGPVVVYPKVLYLKTLCSERKSQAASATRMNRRRSQQGMQQPFCVHVRSASFTLCHFAKN